MTSPDERIGTMIRAKERLEAVPKLISLDDNEVQSAIKECKQLLPQSEVVEEIDPNRVTLRHVASPAGGLYFLYEEQRASILYLVRYRRVELSKLPSGARQVLVWRSSLDATTTNIAQHVFWRYLFKRFRVLVSDSQQSEKGRSFWQYQVQYALAHGHSVTLVNTNDQTTHKITSPQELGRMQDKVWDPRDWFKRILLVIS